MKKNRTFLTVFLVIMTGVLLVTTVYISNLLSSEDSPTQIKKTKAAAVTYSKEVDLSEPTPNPTIVPTSTPALIALAPTLTLAPSPTILPLLVYQSTTISPTLIPVIPTAEATLTPTKKVLPTGVGQLPASGWIQTSSILFIVAASTILFSLLF